LYGSFAKRRLFLDLIACSPLAASTRSAADIQATGNIAGFLVGIFAAQKTYKKITKQDNLNR